MSEIYHRYVQGEVIPATDLGTDQGLRLYGEVIHFEWRKDRTTAQLGMDGEIYYQNHYPTEVKQVKQSDVERLDASMDQMRITEIRHELAKI